VHENKVVLVTGGASGIGQLAARRMADAGASVVAVDVNEQGLRETAQGREGIHTRILDVTDTRAVEEAVRKIQNELGPIDRVYNAAAIMPTSPLLDQGIEAIRNVMEINYGGVANVAMAVMPGMLERGHGDLINFASLLGWMPLPHHGAYNAAKFAIVAFTEVLHYETRNRGVRVVCVCPPAVATPLLEQAKPRPKILDRMPPIQPDEVLDAIEKGLEAGDLWVFPGRGTSLAWRLRRLAPSLVWRAMLRIEGV
jgi:NAD(P)-dependent dehydrogenase (short-subunit alcohol dehydrogenase family)